MFLQLGKYKFEGIKLPQSWNSNYETIYGEIPIISRKPILQKVGEKLIEIELTAFFSQDFCTPKDEISKLNESRVLGEVLQLTDGTGVNIGKYVITTFQVINQNVLDNGYVTGATVSITLREYNSNETINAIEGDSYNAIIEAPIAPLASPSQSIQNDLNEAKKNTNKIQNTVSNATSLTIGKYKEISEQATHAKNSFDSANAKVEETIKVVQRAQDLQTSIDDCNSALVEVINASDINNFNDLLLANDKLTIATKNLEGANAPIVAFIATREGGK